MNRKRKHIGEEQYESDTASLEENDFEDVESGICPDSNHYYKKENHCECDCCDCYGVESSKFEYDKLREDDDDENEEEQE